MEDFETGDRKKSKDTTIFHSGIYHSTYIAIQSTEVHKNIRENLKTSKKEKNITGVKTLFFFFEREREVVRYN